MALIKFLDLESGRLFEAGRLLPYYMKFSRHVNFANFAI